MRPQRQFFAAIAVMTAVFSIAIVSCAPRGLLTESTSGDLYAGARSLDQESARGNNPLFIAYGDTQSGWRVKEKFARRENWVTKKAFIFPFFQLYTIGQGIVGGVNWVRKVPDYGGVERRLVRDAVYAAARSDDVDFILNLGDICTSDGRRPQHWETFLNENAVDVPLIREVPYVTVLGNHDRANDETRGLTNYQAVFDHPRFYVLDFPDLALFVLDSNFILDQNHHIDDDEQDGLFRKWFVSDGGEPSWLETVLAARNQRFKIVAMHHPLASVGAHHKDWDETSWGRDLRAKRSSLLDLLFDSGVQVLFSGHEHNYEHLRIRRARDDSVIEMVVSSGGGAPIRALMGDDELERRVQSYQSDGLDVELVARAEVHHYTRVDVSANELIVETISVPRDGSSAEIDNIRVGN